MAGPSDVPDSSKYEEDFLRILNNAGKAQKGDALPVRKRGFVVLVRGASNLKPIQSLCFDTRQTYNACFTARYRLQPEAAIGTLIVAFRSDLNKIVRGEKDLIGDLAPATSENNWKRFGRSTLIAMGEGSGEMNDELSRIQNEFLRRGKQGVEQGTLSKDELSWNLGNLGSETSLRTGQRLVLFGELNKESTGLAEWQTAMDMLFTQLPERVGIVLSGAPKDFVLPKDDPHFLEITLPKDHRWVEEPGQLVYKYADSSFHSDVPAEKDELGVNDYANAIARFILHRSTTPPLTIGIHGVWGRGKSSFMKLIDLELIKHAQVNGNEKRPELNGETRTQRWRDLQTKREQAEPKILALSADQKPGNEALIREHQRNKKEEDRLWKTIKKEAERNVISIAFNAWQFEDAKQIWAGLASQISEGLEKSLSWRAQQWLRIEYAWKERRTELILNLLLPLATFCFVAGLFSISYFRHLVLPDNIDSPVGGLLKFLLPAGSILLTIWFFSSHLLKIAKPMSERVLSYVTLPNYRDQMGFQHRVRSDLRFVHDFLTKRRKECKVVVYIDDLDRCSEDKIMEILQAINLILADCQFFVFVGMNTEIIQRAIESSYKDRKLDVVHEDYLDKIIQLSFHLPETMPRKRGYLGTLFSTASRFELQTREPQDNGRSELRSEYIPTPSESTLSYDLSRVLNIVPVQLKEAEDTADELQAFCDYSEFVDDNPRKILRLINSYRLIKILIRNDTSWTAQRQRKLVKWRIFCERWPDLVGDVLAGQSKTSNCLSDLAASLAKSTEQSMSPGRSTLFDPLKRFAELNEQDALSNEDIDQDFRLAAHLLQMVR
jgi:hypothetical protein